MSTAPAQFSPHPLLAHPQVQSVLATKGPRRRRWLRSGNRMQASASLHLLDCGGGVRLNGYHSPQPDGGRGLAVLIHGWEGSHDSIYLYSMACELYARGWNIFRLNLRDHGGTHSLNREPFHSARMDEVLGAFRPIRALPGAAAGPLAVIGFSLGGNFALRVGLQGPAAGVVPALSVGISPSIDPGATLLAIDQGPAMFRLYFLDRWRKTLEAKQRAWPGAYDFSAYKEFRSFVETTRQFAVDFTSYGSYENYLAAYTLTPRMLMDSPTPLAVITAQDDPVIPYRDFAGLSASGSVATFDAPARGGHCGFIENFAMECWTERRVGEMLELL